MFNLLKNIKESVGLMNTICNLDSEEEIYRTYKMKTINVNFIRTVICLNKVTLELSSSTYLLEDDCYNGLNDQAKTLFTEMNKSAWEDIVIHVNIEQVQPKRLEQFTWALNNFT